MNPLDLLVVGGLALGAWAGYRRGLLARVLSWAGLYAGFVVAGGFIDDAGRVFQGSSPRMRLFGSLAFFLMACAIGQLVGVLVGTGMHRLLPPGVGLRMADRLGGAAVGLLGVLVIVWLLTPPLASVPGAAARAMQGSAIARAVNRFGPEPPHGVRKLGLMVGDAPFPEVFDRVKKSPDVTEPPLAGLDPARANTVRSSVVRIEGEACRQTQRGSGVVVGPGAILTAAHVVAGEVAVAVYTPDGVRFDAAVVAFDARNDVAVLRAPIALPALQFGEPAVGAVGAVFGASETSSIDERPARIERSIHPRGSDIYRDQPVRRHVLVLAARSDVHDAGGPMVDESGRVVGLVFVVDPAESRVAYALNPRDVEGMLGPVLAGGNTPVTTGRCLF